MKCDEFLLEAYVDDFLTKTERRDVEQHVESCVNCRTLLQQFQQEQLELIRDLNAQKLQKSLANNIMAKIEQPVRKKRHWKIPLTVAATAMLGFGLLMLNKEALLQSGTNEQIVKAKSEIVFDEISVEAGQINIWLHLEDAKGQSITPEQLANVKVFSQKTIDITDTIQVLVTSNEGGYHYVIELEHMGYDELTVQFTYAEQQIEQSIDVNVTNKSQTVEFEHLQFMPQGRRLKDDTYEVFYRLGFNDQLRREYEQIDKEIKETYEHNGIQGFYWADIGYELYDADGLMLIGERADTSWEGLGFGETSSSTDVFGEVAATLTIPKSFGNFPMTMRVHTIHEIIPINFAITVDASHLQTFNFQGQQYKVSDVFMKDGAVSILVEGPSQVENQPGSWNVAVDGRLYITEFSHEVTNIRSIYELTIPLLQSIPKQFDLMISSIIKSHSIEPVDIILE